MRLWTGRAVPRPSSMLSPITHVRVDPVKRWPNLVTQRPLSTYGPSLCCCAGRSTVTRYLCDRDLICRSRDACRHITVIILLYFIRRCNLHRLCFAASLIVLLFSIRCPVVRHIYYIHVLFVRSVLILLYGRCLVWRAAVNTRAFGYDQTEPTPVFSVIRHRSRRTPWQVLRVDLNFSGHIVAVPIIKSELATAKSSPTVAGDARNYYHTLCFIITYHNHLVIILCYYHTLYFPIDWYWGAGTKSLAIAFIIIISFVFHQ